MRLHHDFDYLDEDALAEADISDGTIHVGDETHELLILPPMTHLKLSTVETLERFVAAGGRVLATILLPTTAFGERELVDVSARIDALFGVDPAATQRDYTTLPGIDTVSRDHPGGGKTTFLRSHALNRQLPRRLQPTAGIPEGPHFLIEEENGESRYWYAPANAEREDLTTVLTAERAEVARALHQAITGLIQPDVVIDNPDVFCLHRVKDDRDLYFLVNSTRKPQSAEITLPGTVQPWLWDPSTTETRPIASSPTAEGATRFRLELPPVGSIFVTTEPSGTSAPELIAASSIEPFVLDGDWEFTAEDDNALVIRDWLATPERPGTEPDAYDALDLDTTGWLPVTMGAWSYQLPAEPERPYPIDVWYRIGFEAPYVPPHLDLVIDGFAGSGWSVYVNGQPVTAQPVRSKIDSQMQSLDITPYVQSGTNVIAVRLTVTKANGRAPGPR